ncbi:MAG: ferrous iron transport protein B [Clostridiales bacterium]|nr:ferrous iron transport protein B [Clostridiales bacterium]
MNGKKTVVLMGNPNVGKSTVFNELTGMHTHTGNWTGKTVDALTGTFYYKYNDYTLTDLPGTYSLLAHSQDEEIACDTLFFSRPDVVVCVVDAASLERNLSLVLQVRAITRHLIVLLNMCDAAEHWGITVDDKRLSEMLGVPVVRATARSGRGINCLLEEIHTMATGARPVGDEDPLTFSAPVEMSVRRLQRALKNLPYDFGNTRFAAEALLRDPAFAQRILQHTGIDLHQQYAFETAWLQAQNTLERFDLQGKAGELMLDRFLERAKTIAAFCSKKSVKTQPHKTFMDKILLGKYTSYLATLLILALILWLTIVGSNYPSQWLKTLVDIGEVQLTAWLTAVGAPQAVVGVLCAGVYRVLGWVVSVMLPPMAIFFPLFALAEDVGLLPRFAFQLDPYYARCGACGKQALTMCMGLGCNAVGITGARIIDSPRERLLAIVTNALTPCNGRFPFLIAVITMFFTANSFYGTLILLLFLCVSVGASLLSSLLLSKTLLRGQASSFVLEIPSFKRPQFFRVVGQTLKSKVLFVLGRAVCVAAPAGLLIWVLANVQAGDESLLVHISSFLDPAGRAIGLDGTMLLAFILGFPANEIVLPIALMTYLSSSSLVDYGALDGIRTILVENGWTVTTAVCACVFSMFHFPCSTALWTVYKETKSIKWSAVSFFLPLLLGAVCCAVISGISRLLT